MPETDHSIHATLIALGYNKRDNQVCTLLVAKAVADWINTAAETRILRIPAGVTAVFANAIPERESIAGGVVAILAEDSGVQRAVAERNPNPQVSHLLELADDEPLDEKKTYQLRFKNGNVSAAGSIADVIVSANSRDVSVADLERLRFEVEDQGSPVS